MALARRMMINRLEWDALTLIHGFIGTGAVAGGISLLTDWMSMSQQTLDESDFSTFTITGLSLAIVIGGTSLVAALSVWRRLSNALTISLFASLALTGWFVIQIAQFGIISWMQPFIIALLLPKPD